MYGIIDPEVPGEIQDGTYQAQKSDVGFYDLFVAIKIAA